MWEIVVNLAVAALTESLDSIWLIKVNETNCVSTIECVDDYGNKIPAGINFLKGNFLERDNTTKTSTIFRLSKKSTFFYKETVVFPYVEIEEHKRGLVLQNKVFMDIICHVEQNGYSHL